MSTNTEPHNDPAIDLRAVTRAVFEILRPTTAPVEVEPATSTLPKLSVQVRPLPTVAVPSMAAPPTVAVPQTTPDAVSSLPVPALASMAVGSLAPPRPAGRSSDALAILDEIAFLDA